MNCWDMSAVVVVVMMRWWLIQRVNLAGEAEDEADVLTH